MKRVEFLNKYPMRMPLDEFIETALFEGSVDWDGSYGEQCVDLFRFYCHCVLGLERQPAGVVGAKDFFINFKKDDVLVQNFIRIENTPEFIPEKGDVCIWGASSTNLYGHISIDLGHADVKTLLTLDQNVVKFTVTKQRHGYNNFLGVLRPRQNIKE